RTRHGVVRGRATGGSAVAVLGDPSVGSDGGIGCACTANAMRRPKLATRDRLVMAPPTGLCCSGLAVSRRTRAPVYRYRNLLGQPTRRPFFRFRSIASNLRSLGLLPAKLLLQLAERNGSAQILSDAQERCDRIGSFSRANTPT